MATKSPMAGPSPEEVAARYLELIRESDEIDRRFQLKEQEELQALEHEKTLIKDAIREEREKLVAGMPAEMPFPESFDRFLAEKLNDRIQKKQAEYDLKKVERKKLHDAAVLKHAEKWKTVLFATQSNPMVSAPDLELVVPERPKPPVQVSAPVALPITTQAPVQPRIEQTRPAEAPRAPAHQREGFVPMVPSQANQFPGMASIAVPQLLPRPPPVPSQSQVGNPQPRQHQNNASLHHQHPHPHTHPHPHPHQHANPHQHTNPHPQPQSRPADVQRGHYIPAQPRMPDHPAVQHPTGPKQRTALPDNGRAPEGIRPEVPRQTPQGSLNLPRILPLAEQQQHQTQHSTQHSTHPQRSENEQFKRKADVQAVPAQLEPKRAKVLQETSGNDNTGGSRDGRKTITFDQVYQNGNAEYKHIIVEYPTNSRRFYILKCEEHGVHFNMNPLAGAAKHLHSAQHGNMSKERAQAVEFLGYQIVDCDEAKMQQNNVAVTDAFAKGYKPLNLNQLSKAERASRNLPGDNAHNSHNSHSPTGTPKAPVQRSSSSREGFIHERPVSGPQAHQKIFTGITHPVPGELYLGYWTTEKRNYAVLMLPFGDLKPAGMQGTLESTGLLEPKRVPRCYIHNPDTNTWGWAPGYEDQGGLITRREFPVMYFDGRSSVGWLRAKDLSPFNFDDPLWREIPFFKDAVHYYAKVKGYSGFQEMREKNAGKDGRFFGRNQLGLQLGGPLPNPTSTAGSAPSTGTSTVDNSGAHGDGRNSETAMVSPSEEVEMVDASPVSDRDSYQESINRGMLDSDNDAEMANTESRRTSISNRGESQSEQGAPEKVLRQPFAQPIPTGSYPPRPADMARPYPENPTGGVYRMPLVGAPPVQMPPNAPFTSDGHGPRGPSAPSSHVAGSKSPSELAQIIASRALHLQSPERDSTAASASAQNEHSSRPPTQSNGHGARRVEKIYASNNPYRTSPSQSPSMATAMLSDRRSENGAHSLSRTSSPASLHNILQKPSAQTQPVMARPGPLSQNGPASFQSPQQGRHVSLSSRAPPLEQNGSLAASPQPAMRSPSMFANFPRVPPSPPQPQGLGIRQVSQSPVMEQYERARAANSPPTAHASNPPTRTPTPVILRSNSESFTTNGDRWRAVRTEPTSQSETSTPQPSVPIPAVSYQHQPALNGVSTSPRSMTEPPCEPPVTAPITTVGETRIDSTFQSREPKASPTPFVKPEAGVQSEVFDLACVSDDKEVAFDHSKTGGQLLRLTVDPQSRVASTAPDASVKVTVDPKFIRQAVVQGSNVSPTASTVSLIRTDGKELELVFEMSDSSSGRIHARRFCRWMKGVNSNIDYKNNTSLESTNSTRRGSSISGAGSSSATPVVNID